MEKERFDHIGENFNIADLPVLDRQKAHLLSLRDYFGDNVVGNVELFESVFRPLYDSGQLQYHRRILSPIDPVVKVWDHTTKIEKSMLMFGSNNYLGFANEPLIKARVVEAIEKFGVGMAGPMILNGTGFLQKELEKALAEFKGKEDAVVLPTGYQANLAWVTALMTDRAVLFYDEASHASLVDAIRLGKKKAFRFSGHDLNTLEDLLKKYRFIDTKRDIFVCLQGVYSMSGEVADLKAVAALTEKYSAFLVVDDAHGTGVLGRGRGTAEHFGISDKVKISMGTFSKSFAVTGGFLAGDRKMMNYIRYFARPYFFTAAVPPMIAAAVLAGVEIIKKQPERVAKVLENAQYFRKRLDEVEIKYNKTDSAIIPVFPSNPENFRKMALALHEANLFVNPIEPPAVPLGYERFRVSVMSSHTHEHIDQAINILKTVFTKFRV